MVLLENEITRWIEILGQKGYFAYLDKQQYYAVIDRFLESIRHAILDKPQATADAVHHNIAFKTEGRSQAVNFKTDVTLAIDHNFQITLVNSDLFVKNKETGITFNLNSTKSLLDLTSIVTIGKILPISKEPIEALRTRRKQGPRQKRGKSPGIG
ncbi:hypothetical protein [Chitinophaga sp. S165]|uniref:hypothetical protein n=1 Tax=Chitinophaga sp. S165 TaxID=2135462 RepID=UPI000D708FDC|nr:hypothetical protein [Chitinophaga sp. S165]PWV47149.1 hypothetical protein C7475_109237 [Chitinophaga sp. S165]